MATVVAPDYVRDDWEGVHDTTRTFRGPDRLILRRTGSRPASRIRQPQTDAMNALGFVARYWKQTLTAAQRLQWGTKGDILQLRDSTNLAKWAFVRWIQVQMDLRLWGFAMEPTDIERWAFAYRSLAINDADTDNQLVELGWEWQADGTIDARITFMVSQVPPQYIDDPYAWKYAVLIGANDYNPVFPYYPWTPASDWYTLKFPAKSGDEVQLFVRITTYENNNPPITKQSSFLSTEEWEPLTIVMP